MNDVGPRRPPAANRFRKGQSGNPKGRPKTRAEPSPSAFDIVMDRSLTVTQNGKPRELTVEEALQHRTYEQAIAGNRAAQRQVLRMIAKREQWLATKRAKRQSVQVLVEPTDPDNADDALLLLGIAKPDAGWKGLPGERRHLLLQPWAVQLALSRGRRRFAANDVAEIKRCTRDPETLRWPAGARGEHDE